MNAIAYDITGQDNGAFFFLEAPARAFCPVCGSVTDDSYLPERLKNVRSKYPFSYTYDGRPIATSEFRDFCMMHDPAGLDFALVHKTPSLYLVKAKRVVKFDSAKRRTTTTHFCDECQRFAQVAGATPGFLTEIDAPLGYQFVRTDVEFGSYREKHPSIIVGPELKCAMERMKFKGIYFHPVYGSSTTFEEAVAASRKRSK
jgi:hypothetical protein